MSGQSTGISYSFGIEKYDFIRAGEASSNIKKILRQVGIDPSIIRKIAIAAYEAEMNIVIHSSSGGSMNVEISPSYVKVTALDSGPGIDNINLAMQEGFSTAPDWIREMGFGAGMGLSNMQRCSDYFNIETEKGIYTRVTIRIDL